MNVLEAIGVEQVTSNEPVATHATSAGADIVDAPRDKAILLERVRLHPDVRSIHQKYRELRDNGVVTTDATRLHDYKRWSIVYERLVGYRTLIDIGIGFGQLVNCAMFSGRFDHVIGADYRPHSGLQRLSGFQEVKLNLIQPLQDETLQAEVVTCLEVIEHLPPDMVPLAIQNLRKIAKKKLIVTVPYEEDPLPSYHKQTFTYSSLSKLLDGGDITLIVERRFARWAMVEITLA